MPQYLPREYRGLGDVPRNNIGAEPGVGDRVRLFRSTIHLDQPFISSTSNAAQWLTTDTALLVPGQFLLGMRFLYGMLTTSLTLGTSTVAIGVAGATTRYRAATVFTAVDTPTLFGTSIAGMSQGPITTAEDIIMTIGVANLPNTATHRLIVDLYFGNA
jgi:hypothetical protein